MPADNIKTPSVRFIEDANDSSVGHFLLLGKAIDEWGDAVNNLRRSLQGKQYSEFHMWIASPGGDVFNGLIMHDLVYGLRGKTKTYAHIVGLAASMATVLASAAEVVEISRQALYMVHRGSVYMWGNYTAEEMQSHLSMLLKYENRLIEVYERRTGMGRDSILEMLNRTEFMEPQDALDLGFVDQVTDSLSIPLELMEAEDSYVDDFWLYYKAPEMKQHLAMSGFHRVENSLSRTMPNNQKGGPSAAIKKNGWTIRNRENQEVQPEEVDAALSQGEGNGQEDQPQSTLEERVDRLTEMVERLLEDKAAAGEQQDSQSQSDPAQSTDPQPDPIMAKLEQMEAVMNSLANQRASGAADTYGRAKRTVVDGGAGGEIASPSSDGKRLAFDIDSPLGRQLQANGIDPKAVSSLQERVRRKRAEAGK